MKFKVGDKVKFIKKIHSYSNAVSVGNIYTINYVDEGTSIPYRTEEDFEWFKEEELELAQLRPFAKSDLQDGDIVTQRDGCKKIVCGRRKKLRGINELTYLPLDNYTENLLDKDGDTEYDIIKVEQPQYETVFECKEEILNKAEKKYLQDVIRPFRDKVKGITKEECKNKHYIAIDIKNDSAIDLPIFEKDTMYKNMKADYIYSLEELRIIGE